MVSVVVGPHVALGDLVLLVLSLMHCNHLLLLCLQVQFILHHQLSVCLLLHCPQLFLFFLSLLCCFVVSNLLSSLFHDGLLLLWCQPLEVIWYKSVRSQLTSCCVGILRHQVTVVHIRDLPLVLLLLVLSPLLFLVSLLSGESLILLLHLLHHLLTLGSVFIFQHAPHSV